MTSFLCVSSGSQNFKNNTIEHVSTVVFASLQFWFMVPLSSIIHSVLFSRHARYWQLLCCVQLFHQSRRAQDNRMWVTTFGKSNRDVKSVCEEIKGGTKSREMKEELAWWFLHSFLRPDQKAEQHRAARRINAYWKYSLCLMESCRRWKSLTISAPNLIWQMDTYYTICRDRCAREGGGGVVTLNLGIKHLLPASCLWSSGPAQICTLSLGSPLIGFLGMYHKIMLTQENRVVT